MIVDFERTKQEISGHSILVTSWYDEQESNWRASAPRYSHVPVTFFPDRAMCTTRKAAIDQLIGVMTSHFAREKAIPSEGILFL